MIVLTLSKCPVGVRGDITKWLMEISTGVYVGNINPRIREALWDRICANIKNGEATMVFSTNNEQGFAYCVHNTTWKPIDFDGVLLMKKPLPEDTYEKEAKPQNKNTKLKTKREDHKNKRKNEDNPCSSKFIAIDIETSGLSPDEHQIIEIAAIKYDGEHCIDKFQCLMKCQESLAYDIVRLTGITDENLQNNGIEPKQAIHDFISFIGTDTLIGHYISFDIKFLKKACERNGIVWPHNKTIDTIQLARKQLKGMVENYRLETLVRHFKIAETQQHRALYDSQLAAMLYLKLNGII